MLFTMNYVINPFMRPHNQSKLYKSNILLQQSEPSLLPGQIKKKVKQIENNSRSLRDNVLALEDTAGLFSFESVVKKRPMSMDLSKQKRFWRLQINSLDVEDEKEKKKESVVQFQADANVQINTYVRVEL